MIPNRFKIAAAFGLVAAASTYLFFTQEAYASSVTTTEQAITFAAAAFVVFGVPTLMITGNGSSNDTLCEPEGEHEQ